MSDNFEKAAEDDAWLYRHRTNELDLKPTTTFVAGALWARAYLEKTTVPQEIVEELVKALEMCKMWTYTDNLTVEELRHYSGGVYRVSTDALTRYREWKKSNE